jgi:ElaB/YqjD/DUF883 family membrane-anchored ribosome-binding protein
MEANDPEDTSAEAARARGNALEPGTRDDLVRATEDAGAAIEELYRVGNAFVGRQAEDNPYAVLGVAAGVGFVLGGGLAWKMAGRLINLAGRIAVTRMVEEWVNRKEVQS